MGVSLVMFTENGERREFPIDGEQVIIGRTRHSSIQVPLPEISRRHCALIVEGDKLRVRDLGSSNGTYVNNRRIQEVELAAGETLTVGPVIFTVVVDGNPANIRPIKTVVHQKPDKKNGHARHDSNDGSTANGKHKPFVTPDDSATIDFHDAGDLMSLDEEEDEGPLAELAALSKQKSKGKL